MEDTKKIEVKEKTAWEKLQIARLAERPTTLDYIKNIFDSFIELHGDRQFRDDPAIVGGIGKINEIAVTIIGQERGRNVNERIKRNFGMPHPEGYRKALRLMKQAEKFKRPVICFIDTQGAYPGVGAEERGQGEAIARNLMEMSLLKTPIISIVIGEGESGGALAMAVADEVWMMENAIYSVLSPEGFASILWKDSKRAQEATEVIKATAKDLKQFEIIDKIIEEPEGGAHLDSQLAAQNIKNELLIALPKLCSEDKTILLQNRYDKFRKIGKFIE